MPVLQCFLRDQKLLSGKHQRYFSTQTECWRVGNSPSELHIGQPCLWWLEICQEERYNACSTCLVSLNFKFYWRWSTIYVYNESIFHCFLFVYGTLIHKFKSLTNYYSVHTVFNHYSNKKSIKLSPSKSLIHWQITEIGLHDFWWFHSTCKSPLLNPHC